jgi:antitoxin component of MazEF toxin-antitoxin module
MSQQGDLAVSQVVVEKWGRDLAIHVPLQVARAVGLSDGERVEIEAQDGDVVVRRSAARARMDAEAAAAEIVAESRQHPLGNVSLRALLEKGGLRRGGADEHRAQCVDDDCVAARGGEPPEG